MDHVSSRIEQWRRELPDVDTVGMAVLGRMRWITLQVRPGIEAVFARHGLDTGEFDVLSTLLRAGPPYRLRPTELFRSLMITSGGLTPRLDRLTNRGLIRRAAESSDKRSLPVELTAEGRALVEAAFREDMLVERALISGLSAKDRDRLSSLLEELALIVGQAVKEQDQDGPD
ncbi:MarR family winged helix-turn-helix transcriptional regulator [Brevundimonas faecalis]|uniref:DNA-binding MarR family transcriptional regulator n=1 Tax=Brevundimonas faecalis TaxID=947378 RepID=A0ABV2R9R1_9CAUL